MKYIIPEKDLWDSLLRVGKPGRYVGGEFCCRSDRTDTDSDSRTTLYVALSYPDLYEIGMSNNAIQIIYSLLNSLPGITCELVFTPAPDFEAELRKKKIPLYSLESGKPLCDFDIVCFSFGFELCATNILTMLDLGNISIHTTDRQDTSPVIIAGGPAVTNPAPLSPFIDCFFIGEAEGIIETLFTDLLNIKKSGGNRSDFIERLYNEPCIWNGNNPGHSAHKNTWMGFSHTLIIPSFPVPNIKIVQDHGVTEIMRGCPNKCRFCHASIFYRPFRFKNPRIIYSEIEHQILKCGYREITLSSLSSGDYKNIDILVRILSNRFKHAGVSFALPSLRINSMSLSLLKDISSVRKSGLTFAVETPDIMWQSGLNKQVSFEKTVELLLEAKKKGWRSAKFYFMIGLPLYETDESEEIVSFLQEVKFRTKMQLTINISTFIPKPHTPFQWAAQLDEEESLRRFLYIKRNLPGKNFKVNFHSPFASTLEGIIARGSKEVGTIILNAYNHGARLDAWDDYLQKDIWRMVLEESETDIVQQTLGLRKTDEELPWDSVHLGISKYYLKREWEKALNSELTDPCSSSCLDQCGSCVKDIQVNDLNHEKELDQLLSLPPVSLYPRDHKKLLISFKKTGKAAFLSHLNCMLVFERSFLRAGYLLRFTRGFNPKPIIEFASPLALGLESRDEICSCELDNYDSPENFILQMNKVLPMGIEITKVKELPPYITGTKKISLTRLFWGSDFFFSCEHEIGKIIHIFAQLNDVGNEVNELHDFSPALDSFFMIGNGLCIRWKKIEKKGYNIIHFLQMLTGQKFFDLGIKISRMNTLAHSDNSEPVHYFEIM